MEIVRKLHTFDNVGDMADWLNLQGQDFIRSYLLREFEKVCYYENLHDWNNAVIICEALAIIGWGDDSFINAICIKTENRWETKFLSAREKKCFRNANWLNRKAGFFIANYLDFHDDGIQSDYTGISDGDIVCQPADVFMSQRNYKVDMPFNIFNGNVKRTQCPTFTLAEFYAEELMSIFYSTIKSGCYETAIESFEININVGWVPEMWTIKEGRYNAKRKEYKTMLRIDRNFDSLTEKKQRDVFVAAVNACVKTFLHRLKIRKVDFDSTMLLDNIEQGLSEFAVKAGTKERARLYIGPPNVLDDILDVRKAMKDHRQTTL